eukprot:10335429-Lingulodinium_polyedra.AAC.1
MTATSICAWMRPASWQPLQPGLSHSSRSQHPRRHLRPRAPRRARRRARRGRRGSTWRLRPRR